MCIDATIACRRVAAEPCAVSIGLRPPKTRVTRSFFPSAVYDHGSFVILSLVTLQEVIRLEKAQMKKTQVCECRLDIICFAPITQSALGGALSLLLRGLSFPHRLASFPSANGHLSRGSTGPFGQADTLANGHSEAEAQVASPPCTALVHFAKGC